MKLRVVIGLILCITVAVDANGMFGQRKSRAHCGKLIDAVLAGEVDKVQQALRDGADAKVCPLAAM